MMTTLVDSPVDLSGEMGPSTPQAVADIIWPKHVNGELPPVGAGYFVGRLTATHNASPMPRYWNGGVLFLKTLIINDLFITAGG